MARTLKIRKPTAREMRWLELRLEEDLLPAVQRRAQAILHHGLGLNGRAIAQALQVHFNTIYADLRAFAREGLACVGPCQSAHLCHHVRYSSLHLRKSSMEPKAMNRRHTFQMILLAPLAALTLLPACTSLFGVELSNGGDYSPFALRITAHHQSSPCAKAGEPIQIRFTVTNYSQQPFVVASNLPIIDFIVQESAGMNPVYSWATQNPKKVEPRLEWRPGESKVIELSWSVPQKEYVPGHAAVIGGMLSEDGKIVYGVPVSVCLGIPFEPR